MSDVLVFLADLIARMWSLYLDSMPSDFLAYVVLLFLISCVVARLVVPVVSRAPDRFFNKGKGGD